MPSPIRNASPKAPAMKPRVIVVLPIYPDQLERLRAAADLVMPATAPTAST